MVCFPKSSHKHILITFSVLQHYVYLGYLFLLLYLIFLLDSMNTDTKDFGKERSFVRESLMNLVNFTKLPNFSYLPNLLQFNYYYQYFNIFAKLYFAKLIFAFSLNFCKLSHRPLIFR